VTALCFLAVLCLAAGMRIPDLTLRPVHGDEANQAVKTGQLFETGKYRYDPHEHHGPSLYYLTLPVLYSCGVPSFEASSIAHFRVVPVIFGLLLIVLLWPLRKALGGAAIVWTALLMAVSTPLVFYSRYYVQEMLLVCFVQAAFVSGWLYLRRPCLFWALAFGCCLGLIHATKETSILIVFSVCLAGVATLLLGRLRDKTPFLSQLEPVLNRRTAGHLVVALLMAGFVSITLFSSFYTHARGPLDSVLTYTGYFARAEGAGSAGLHDKPWYYYLLLLSYVYRQAGPRWTEAPVLLAGCLGAVAVLVMKRFGEAPREREVAVQILFRRFLLFYTLFMLVIYSLIPYKTPWNLLPFYHGVLLLAGLGIASVLRAARYTLPRAVLVALALAGVALIARQSYLGNFTYFADARNPYVYAHPSRAVERLVERVADIAAIAETGRDLHINIIRPDGDYWPLPWYLRAYTRVGWWHKIPDHADADILFAAPELYESLKVHLNDQYLVEFHALRPGVLLHAYIRQDLWDVFIKSRGGG
jgi:uncharacterized protein (TIGR03663 family)